MTNKNGAIRLTATESQYLYLRVMKKYSTKRIAKQLKLNMAVYEDEIENIICIATGQATPCPYSNSCFSCPCSDCMISEDAAPQTNVLYK